jgi:hypothetical protein
MPRHLRQLTSAHAKHDELVSELAAELRDSHNPIQPVIIEDETPENQTLRVQVIWAKWDGVPYELRTSIILDAYERIYGAARRAQITFALGYDFYEGRNVGLLPFSLRPSTQAATDEVFERQRQAMRDIGAPVELADHGPQLWFATIEDAETAMKQLEIKTPLAKWLIVEEAHRDAW